MARGDHVTFRGGTRIDMALLLGIVGVATLGVMNLYSATSVYTESAKKGLAEIYTTQVYYLVFGGLTAMAFAFLDYRHLERLAYVFYAGGIAALGLVFALGEDIRGSSRWIQIGSFNFQPSEFMKILLILVVAKYLHDDPKTEPRVLTDLAIPVALTGLPVFLVMVQPDLGTSLIYMLTAGSMLGMTKIRTRSLLTAGIFSIVSVPLAWMYVLKDYQKLRITSFLDPEHDKTGAGWHAFQSRTAIGNGGLTGEGFTQGTQNQFGFLPDQFSDFPFAVFAEDWGFVGSVALLSLYCFVCIWAVHIASEAKDRFGAAVAVGVGALFFWHTVFNVGMAMNLLPVVGITLPLFSYGGSNVVTMMVGLGLLMSVSMRR